MIGNTQQEFQKYFVKQAISDTAISCALGFHSLKCKRQNEPKVTEIKHGYQRRADYGRDRRTSWSKGKRWKWRVAYQL